MIESGQVPEKGPGEYWKNGRIRASTRKSDDRIWESTKEGSGQVPEKVMIKYGQVPETKNEMRSSR